MRKDTYRFDPSLVLVFEHCQGLSRMASDNFSEVSKIQYDYRKKLFDLYSKNRDDKTKDYFKEEKALEKEMQDRVQAAAKEIYDAVKTALGHELTVKKTKVENKYNFWMYKGNTGVKIAVSVGDKRIMSLKCSRDVIHDKSGALETVKVVMGDEHSLDKRKDKDKFLEFQAKDAKDIINIYFTCVKKLI